MRSREGGEKLWNWRKRGRWRLCLTLSVIWKEVLTSVDDWDITKVEMGTILLTAIRILDSQPNSITLCE